MASDESIQKLVSEDFQNASKQITSLFKDRPEALKKTIQSIALLIADDKPENRPRYLAVLIDVLQINSSKLPSDQLFDLFKDVLQETGHKVTKRARRMALTFCYFAIAEAGYTSKNKNDNLLRQILGEIYNISVNNIWMQASCCKMLIEIISKNILDEDHFLDSFAEIFEPSKEIIPSSVDNLYFWLKLQSLFPKIELSEFYHDPMTIESFVRFTSLLKTTLVSLPIIHPIWHLFADFDAEKLLDIVAQLWLEKGENRPLVSIACAAAVPVLSQQEIIDFISNSKLFEFALKTKVNKNLISALNEKLLPIIENADESSFKLIRALLLIPDEHSFVSETINKGCSSFNDRQTLAMIDSESLQDLTFKPLYALLWTQRHRESINDDSIITKLFGMTAKCAFNFSDKVELTDFIAKNMFRMMPNHKSWFKLISGVELPTQEAVSSIENLIESANKVIDGLNNISENLNITPIFEKCSVSLDSFIDFISQLNKSKFKHWHQISRVLLQKAIPLLGPEHISLIAPKSTLLEKAVQDPRLSESALPFYVEKIGEIHKFANDDDRESFERNISFPISPEACENVLPSVLAKCNGKSKSNLQEKVAIWLFNQINDEAANKIVNDQIDLLLNDEKGDVGGEAFVTMLINQSTTMAYEILGHITEVGGNYEKQSAIHKMENWINDCCRSSEIPVDDIARAIYVVLDHDFQPTSSGKKKAENVLNWAEKLIKKTQRNIPKDMFLPLCEKFKNTGSRNAEKIIRQISGASIE